MTYPSNGNFIISKFKKGPPSEITNYRPISLTCTCCKILETIISSNILQFLYSHNLISKSQHGFLKKHSTRTNSLESVHDWTVSLSNRKSVVIGYIDFDAKPHSKLIHKLKNYGLDGNLLLWISSFPHQPVPTSQDQFPPLPAPPSSKRRASRKRVRTSLIQRLYQ